MNRLSDELKRKIEELEKLKTKISKEYSYIKGKTGILNVSESHGCPQYYIKKNGKREYISKKHINDAVKLAQRDYDSKAIEILSNEIETNKKILKNISREPLVEEYNSLCEARKKLIDKHFMTDEEYIEQWISYQYEGKTFQDGTDSIVTEKGERVRSKSEKIIADKLYSMGIPYRYECPVYLEGLGWVYTDFTLLDVGNREEVYLEHFGMMDREDYARKAVYKIKTYERNGIFQGDKIIYTFETSTDTINTVMMERLIRNRFRR